MNYQYPFPYQQIPNQIPNAVQNVPQSIFVTIHSEDEALRYPVSPGGSVTFKIEGQPTIIEKGMGFSQFESPKVEKYKLVKEGTPEEKEPPKYALSTDLDNMGSSINERIDRIEGELKRMKGMIPRRDRRDKDE